MSKKASLLHSFCKGHLDTRRGVVQLYIHSSYPCPSQSHICPHIQIISNISAKIVFQQLSKVIKSATVDSVFPVFLYHESDFFFQYEEHCILRKIEDLNYCFSNMFEAPQVNFNLIWEILPSLCSKVMENVKQGSV